MSGSKVEGWDREGSEIENVVVGQSAQARSAIRIPITCWICQVDVGAGEPHADCHRRTEFARARRFVPVALHNSTLPGGK